MAFSRTISTQRNTADLLLKVVGALEGDTRLGQPIKLTALNSVSAFALDVRNLGAGGALRVRNIAGTVLLQIDESGMRSGAFALSGAVATNRSLFFQTAGSNRFELRLNNTAETGGNAGSNLEFYRYDDAGAVIDAMFRFDRTGQLRFLKDSYFSAGFLVTGSGTMQGNINCDGGVFTLGGATSKIVPGTASLSLRNHADSADNLLITDAGVVTTRSSLVIGNRPAFVAGDQYLVVDASGNVHVSALGPAS